MYDEKLEEDIIKEYQKIRKALSEILEIVIGIKDLDIIKRSERLWQYFFIN